MCVLCLELKQKYCERTDRTEKMPKKDTKLQKLSESIQYTIEEMRGLGIEGLDQLFQIHYPVFRRPHQMQ